MPAEPRASVVVATRDRRPRLEELLRSLRAQTLESDQFEVIVVDDGSRDSTPALLRSEVEAPGLRFARIRRSHPEGPSSARNAGWREARSPLVAFIDDDCVATPRWLESLLRASDGNPGGIVQGQTQPIPAELDRRGRTGPFSRTLRVDRKGPHYQTCNIVYPRSVLERLDGFDAEVFPFVGEDADLAWRAMAGGTPVVFEPSALVFHAVNRLGPIGKLRLAARWTESIRLFKRHPGYREACVVRGVFWKGTHYLLLRALVALVLPRRLRLLRSWLAGAYLAHLVGRGRAEGGGLLAAPYYALHDLVELVAVVRGAVRYRVPLI